MLGWELEWDKDLAQLDLVARAVLRGKEQHMLASVSQMQQREKEMGRIQERKGLRGQTPVFLWAGLIETSPSAFFDFLKLWWALQEGPSFTHTLFASLANWQPDPSFPEVWGVPEAPFHLFFPFIFKSLSPRNWQSSTQGSIRFQTTRGPWREFQTGKKSAGSAAWCVGHPQEFQLGKNNFQWHN